VSKTTKPAKKKPDHEILSVGDRLSVVVRAFFSPAQPDAAGAYEGIKPGDTIEVPED